MKILRVIQLPLAATLAFLNLLSCKPSAPPAPAVIVWDIHKIQSPADIGWTPKDRHEIGWDYNGDVDFTLIRDATHQFHQRCWHIGVIRGDARIEYVSAYFAKGITLEEAIPLATRVLTDWGDGLRDPPAPGELSVDEFSEKIKRGQYFQLQWGMQGKDGGVIIVSLDGVRTEGMKQRCSLMFRPG